MGATARPANGSTTSGPPSEDNEDSAGSATTSWFRERRPTPKECKAVIDAAFMAESEGRDLKAYALYVHGLDMIVQATVGTTEAGEQAVFPASGPPPPSHHHSASID